MTPILTPLETFLKFHYDRNYWIKPNNHLFYTWLKGYPEDKLFVIERIGKPLIKFGYLLQPEFIVTDCDDLTEKESNRYRIIREQMEQIDIEEGIKSDL